MRNPFQIVIIAIWLGTNISILSQKSSVNDSVSAFQENRTLLNNGDYRQAELNVKNMLHEIQPLDHVTYLEATVLLEEIYYMLDKFDELEKLFIENDIKFDQHVVLKKSELYLSHLLVKASYYRYINKIENSRLLFKILSEQYNEVKLSNEFKTKLFRQLGNFYLFNASEFAKAVPMFDSSLYYLNKTGRLPIDEFNSHWCMGQALTRLKKYYHADEHFRKCENIYKQNNQLFEIEISYIYSYKMEIFTALDNELMLTYYFEKVSSHFETYKNHNFLPSDKNKYYLNFILSYLNISDYYIRKDELNKAVEILLRAERESGNSKILLQYIYDRLSWVYLKLENSQMAEFYAHTLLGIQQQMTADKKNGLADTYFLLSELAAKKEDDILQLNYLENAIQVENVPSSMRIKIYTNLGKLYNRNEQYVKAANYLDAAIMLSCGTLDIDSVVLNYDALHVAESDFLIDALFEKGNVLKNSAANFSETVHIENLKLANSYYKASIDLCEKYLPYLVSDFDIEQLLKRKRQKIKTYLLYLAYLYENNNDFDYINLAFHYIEKSKATHLHQNFLENKAKITVDIPDYLIQQENKLNNNITKLNTLLKLEHDKPDMDEIYVKQISDSLSKLRHMKNQFIVFLEDTYPYYYDLKYNPNTISIQELRVKLTVNEALIHYYMVNDLLFSIYVSDSYTGFHKQTINKEFYKVIENVRAHLVKPPAEYASNENFTSFVDNSNKLYNALILPFSEHIKGKSMIVVPDDILYMVPFDILIENEAASVKDFDYKSLPFLIKSNSISYAYSASLYFSHNLKSEFRNINAFAPVQYQNKKSNENLKQILGTESEVRSIAKIFPTKMYVKSKATEHNFKKTANEKCIIHLATHTILDENNSVFSKMIFHPEQGGIDEDGILYVHEIYNMRFNAPMIVLSSCESGFGQLKPGEGFKSIAWGFKYAGIPSIVMTLWEVPDNVSSSLMTTFYNELKNGNSKDKAIQRSKVNYLNNCDPLKSHPFYWASYNVIGDNSPVHYKHSSTYKYIVFLVSYVLVFLIFKFGLYLKRKE